MFYNVILKLAHLFCLLAFRIRFEGLENIPTDEGFVLSSNHRSNFDPIFIVLKIPKPVRFMAKEELFHKRFLGWLINKLGAFPISRGKGDTGALEFSVNVLQEGSPLLIFPEGTRSKDGKMGRPKSGAAVISGRAGVGILPCSIDYGEKLKFRTEVIVKYHPLLTHEELAVDTENPATIRVASRTLMDTIASGLTKIPQNQKEKAA